ncbi:MAG: flagellar hook-associated protein FlgL [Deltaproteobacteria bacterium]|nr:flagellar hook-associated protein FlgL [Deltaproteobacteria bacterium]
MRVTGNMLFEKLSGDIQGANERLFKTYETLSSGKSINAPSDDPVAISVVFGYKDVIAGLERYSRNIDFANAYLSSAETAVSHVSDTLVRLKELAIGQASGNSTAETRMNTSYEVGELYDGLIAAGNTRTGGRYIFSGYLSAAGAFDANGNYLGDSNAASLKIGPDAAFTYGFTGEKIFKGVGIPAGVDIYKIVGDFKTALETNNVAGLQTAIDDLDKAASQINDITAETGARMNRLDSEKDMIDGFSLEARTLLSGIEDADLAKVSIALATQQTTLQALQAAISKVFELNIFNFLR